LKKANRLKIAYSLAPDCKAGKRKSPTNTYRIKRRERRKTILTIKVEKRINVYSLVGKKSP